jgi:hypothetical protein
MPKSFGMAVNKGKNRIDRRDFDLGVMKKPKTK